MVTLCPRDILRADLLIEIVRMPIHLLCLNMKSSNVDKVAEYFRHLTPQPDLCMFQNAPLSAVRAVCRNYGICSPVKGHFQIYTRLF